MSLTSSLGFIGVGAIGSRLAMRARKAGIEVFAFDIDPATLQPLAADGVKLCKSAAQVAESCGLIVTCVTNPAAVESALLGPGGVIETATPGTLVIETTTSTPAVTRKAAAALASKGAAMIDAPVSRGVPAAEAGTLSIMVGGDPTDIDRADATLGLFGTDIIRTGSLGSGHVAKALNMSVLGANFIALAETMALGLKLGLDRAVLAEAVHQSDAGTFVSGHHYPKYVIPERYESQFSLGLMKKDVGIAASIAAETALGRPFIHRVVDFYDRFPDGDLQGDNTLLFSVIEKDAGLAAKFACPALDAQSHLLDALATTILLGTQEGLMIAAAATVAPQTFAKVLQVSSGGSRMVKRCLATPSAAWGRTVAHVSAATNWVVRAAIEYGVAVPMLGLARDLTARAMARQLSDADATTIWQSCIDR